MKPRTAEQTRELLLEVGLRLLTERGAYLGINRLRLADVVAAAGLTTGAASRCWANQDAFHRDLALAAIRSRTQTSMADTKAVVRSLADAGAGFAEIVRAGAESNLRSYARDTALLTNIASRTYATADPELEAAARDRFRSATESFADLYGEMLERCGRRLPGFGGIRPIRDS